MRIAILMAIHSPWARQVAIRLSELGHTIFPIDFLKINSAKSYLGSSEKIHLEGISELRRNVADILYIKSPTESNARYFITGRQVRNVCNKCKADILFVLYGGGFATMAYYSNFRPYSIYAVGSDVLLVKGIKSWIARRNFMAADLVFVNGLYLTEKTKLLAPKARLKSLYMGVDSDKFPMNDPITGSRVTIICTRGFSQNYNNEYLIFALNELSGIRVDFEVVFPSSGPTLREVQTIADHILSKEMRKCVKFLNGVSDSEMLDNLKGADIYVSLSRSDGTSISLLEALSCGLFPILSDIPQNREWIDPNSENGILVPFDQPAVLAKALKRTILDAQLRKQAGKFNRQLILDLADSRKNMKVLASELEAVIEIHNLKREN